MKSDKALRVLFDTTITPELKAEGDKRKLVREIQMLRKTKGCKIDERVRLVLSKTYQSLPTTLLEEVKKDTLGTDITWGETTDIVIETQSTP